MIRVLRPALTVNSLQEINLKDWYQRGIRGVLIDLDNTISPWRKNNITSEAFDFFERASELKIPVILFTNAAKARADLAAEMVKVPCYPLARKPFPWKYKRVIIEMGLQPHQILTIGDQIFTDTLGGNLAGCITILIPPLEEREHWGTKILRFWERRIGVHQKPRRS